MYLKGWTPKLDGEYYHRGIGTVMLAVASEWLKRNGATVQVLFTGLDNPAQRLYRGAGYRYCSISAHNIRKDLSTRPR